jgi:NADH-quinone oxidoreductase subunit A
MTTTLSYILLFAAMGTVFVLFTMFVGKFVRPNRPNPEKVDIYECGEVTVGSSWVQFDLRFYVVALLYVIFEVEVALFFPWASVFGKATALADPGISQERRIELTRRFGQPERKPLAAAAASQCGAEQPVKPIGPDEGYRLAVITVIDVLVFFAILMVGFAYVWRRGDLDWVRGGVTAGKAPGSA